MEQYCKEHNSFKPCQECAKADIWNGEALIFKRDAEQRIQELEDALKIAQEKERKKWSDWIGNVLTEKHPKERAILWGIAEAIERNNFGVIAKQALGEARLDT